MVSYRFRRAFRRRPGSGGGGGLFTPYPFTPISYTYDGKNNTNATVAGIAPGGSFPAGTQLSTAYPSLVSDSPSTDVINPAGRIYMGGTYNAALARQTLTQNNFKVTWRRCGGATFLWDVGGGNTCYLYDNGDHFILGDSNSTWSRYWAAGKTLEDTDMLGLERVGDGLKLYLNDLTAPIQTATQVTGSTHGPVIALAASGNREYDDLTIVDGVGAPPLQITSTSFNAGDRKITLNFDYTGSPDAYEYQINHEGAWQDTTFVSNAQPGKGVVKTNAIPTSYNGGSPVITLRQKNLTSVTANSPVGANFIPAPAVFGWNIAGVAAYSTFRMTTNLALQGYWQRVNPSSPSDFSAFVNSDNELVSLPTDGSAMKRQCRPPSVSGSRLAITWTGDPSASMNPEVTEGNDVISNIVRVSSNRIEFDYAIADPSDKSFWGVTITGMNSANPIRNLDVRQTNEFSITSRFHPAWIAFQQLVPGAVRLMDLMNANNNYTTAFTWAQRSTRSFFGLDHAAGICIEDIIEICNAIGRDPWCALPWEATDDYITKWIQALQTGANTSNGVALNTARTSYIEFGNETFNAFRGLYHYIGAQALANGRCTQAEYDDGGGFTAMLIEHAYQTGRQMTVVKAAVTDPTKFVKVLATQGGKYHHQAMVVRGLDQTSYDANAQAPYFGFNAGNAPSPYTPAAIEPAWTTDMNNVMDFLHEARDYARSLGKRFIGYEGGPDNTNMNVTDAQLEAWFKSTQMYTIYKTFGNRWANEFGDLICVYNDIGPIKNPYSWGIQNYLGGPYNPRLQALVDVVAGV